MRKRRVQNNTIDLQIKIESCLFVEETIYLIHFKSPYAINPKKLLIYGYENGMLLIV